MFSSATATTAPFSFCLVANLVALMTYPSVLPEVSKEWQLSASDAGWIGGIYFAGYTATVPLLASATDRFDGRWIVAGSSLLGTGASFAFAVLADGALSHPGRRGAALAVYALPGFTTGFLGPAAVGICLESPEAPGASKPVAEPPLIL